MLTDGDSTAIAAGATTNIFLGRPIEFIGAPSVARILMSADAALVSCQLLMNVGGVQSAPIAAGKSVNVASAAGAGPKDDEDQIITNLPIPAGARLQMNVTNGGGATTNVRYAAYILP